MSETERVINDLNAAKLILCNPQMLTPEMCVRIGQAVTNAIGLLKAQEPRVLSLAELLLTGSGTPLFIEERGSTVENAFGYNIYMGCNDGYWCDFLDDLWYPRETYGIHWRCWNIKPTEEQRKVVKWDD